MGIHAINPRCIKHKPKTKINNNNFKFIDETEITFSGDFLSQSSYSDTK